MNAVLNHFDRRINVGRLAARLFACYLALNACSLLASDSEFAELDAQSLIDVGPASSDQEAGVMPDDTFPPALDYHDSIDGPDYFEPGCNVCQTSYKRWRFLPSGNVYPFYLADPKASRLSGRWIETDDDSFLDGNLGGRFGIIGKSDNRPYNRQGWQLDFEGSAQLRLDRDNEWDVHSTDYRAGLPLSVSLGQFAYRFGYYHLSSHVGDEFLLRNPGFPRLNFSRDVLILGGSYWLNERARAYGETGYAFYSDVSEQWEFSFGYESAPRRPTSIHGEPFFAIHGHLMEELDYGGSVNVQLGWAWRSCESPGLLRFGLQYYNGKSSQYSFYDRFEQQVGLGLWYDY